MFAFHIRPPHVIHNFITKMIRQLLIAGLVGLALGASSKVSSNLQQILTTKGNTTVVVNFRQQTQPVLDRVDALRFQTRGAKVTAMKEQLEQLAASSQKDVLALLRTRSVSFQSFWINNRIFIKNADRALVNDIAAISDVTEVREQFTASIDTPIATSPSAEGDWGLEKIQAKEAWALPGGNNGAGVVVSNTDTGVRYTHEALWLNYRSDYGWFDPFTMSAKPSDKNGHGTHTMGTLAGSRGIGVAPGSKWIACKGCDDKGKCDEEPLIACGQWTLCPTKFDGTDADCSKSPAISSNSWSGKQGDPIYQGVVQAWHSAGIIPVFAQGNTGSACGSALSPADLENTIGVGSTNASDFISTFSSRGPTKYIGSIKPDITAPGSDIRSAWHTGDRDYQTISGTSMATPMVSATISLLKAYNPNLSFTQVKSLIEDNAVRTGLGRATACGGVPVTEFPNHVYGHGRLNARNALAAAINNYKP